MKLKYVAGMVGMLQLAGAAQADVFSNGGFEAFSPAGWITGGGHRGSLYNNDLMPARFLGGDLTQDYGGGAIIDNRDIDRLLGAKIGSIIYSGNYAYRVENPWDDGHVTAISQKVSNYTDAQITFAWKAVLTNGGQEENESALLKITLTDDTTGKLLLSRAYNAGYTGSGVDSRFASEGSLFYTPSWQVESMSIDSSLSGHNFTLSLLVADGKAGHTGYAYLDGVGATLPVPEPATYGMLLAGLGLLGVVARRKKSA